jgi:3-oxoacyl-[acyl-carrier-protein] synthase-3
MQATNIRIRSVATTLPGAPVGVDALARRFGMTDSWLQWTDSFVDTPLRHFGFDLDSGRRSHTLADLGETAGAKALDAAGIGPDDIDLLVMGTTSPDDLMPATVNIIADRLGIDDVPSYQLQSGCSGALQALDIAHQMLLTGRHRTALVIGAETLGKHFDAELDLHTADATYAINTVLFGDGAGAAVLTTLPVPDAPLMSGVRVRMVGRGRAPGQTVRWYGMGDLRDQNRQPPASEDYRAIEEQVPQLAREILHDVLDELDWDESDVDYILPPQLSGRMTDRITQVLDLPSAHAVSCVRETANIGNATPFFQLERVLPRMVRGDRAVCVSIESSKWIKAGFGITR